MSSLLTKGMLSFFVQVVNIFVSSHMRTAIELEESAVQESVEESEKPAVEPKKDTMAGTILNLIKSKPKGVNTNYIMEQTGFNKKQVWATVNSAKKKGQIKTTKRGIYVSVKSRKGK